jgi:hypothetical protein
MQLLEGETYVFYPEHSPGGIKLFIFWKLQNTKGKEVELNRRSTSYY